MTATQTLTTFRVTLSLRGKGGPTVQVQAEDKAAAAVAAVDLVVAGDARQTARVAVSGGPAWAAQPTTAADYTVTSVRKAAAR